MSRGQDRGGEETEGQERKSPHAAVRRGRGTGVTRRSRLLLGVGMEVVVVVAGLMVVVVCTEMSGGYLNRVSFVYT